jgi:hypothetical protein
MKPSERTPRDLLLRLDELNGANVDERRAALLRSLERPLTRTRRMMSIVGAIACLVVSGAMASLVFTESAPPWTLLALGLLTAAPLSIASLLISQLRQGAWIRRRHGTWLVVHLTAFGWGFFLLILAKAMVDPDPADLLPHLVLAVAFAILLGVLPLLLHRIERTELLLREGLIQLELGLSKLG